MSPRRLILRSFQSPGDIVMLTAAVRDLHLANPGRFETDVRTTAEDIWLHNPFITKLAEGDPGVESLEMHYPLIHESNQRPYHFIHGYPQYLEQQLSVRVPVTRFCGDIHLSPDERQSPPPGADLRIPERFWIVVAGGKYDFTAKWWNPDSFQQVVDHFEGRTAFVQCGEAGHWHPPLRNVINLVGKTNTREFIRLVYHADGILCPVTFAMHLAAAVETKPGGPRRRACVVIGGGREPAHWEQYPGHQFLTTAGMLPCCAEAACWKSRCQPVGDGDPKDHNDLCLDPIQVRADLCIPRCMELVTPQQVIERIDLYYRGGALKLVSSALNGNGTCTRHLAADDTSADAGGEKIDDSPRQGDQDEAHRDGRSTADAQTQTAAAEKPSTEWEPEAILERSHPTSFSKGYYLASKRRGTDYLDCGDWQIEYGAWLVDALSWKGKRVLDVGCACGGTLRGLLKAGAWAGGIDINEYMISAGRAKWPEVSSRLFVCDVVNLHLLREAEWEGIHCAQVLQHVRPELVRLSLRELARIVAPGGLFFCTITTSGAGEQFGTEPTADELTPACLQTLAWWHDRLVETGWELCGEHIEHRLRSDERKFLDRHDWTWWVARRAQ